MTANNDSITEVTWVAIDIAKKWNVVLVQGPDGKRHRFRVANNYSDHNRLVAFLQRQAGTCRIAMEPTGTYHRPLAYRLVSEGFNVCLISSLAAARYREVTFNSWDKNDPKDAGVILDLLQQGRTLRYYDPIVAGINDLQELSKTYMQVSQTLTRLYHSLLIHYLPLYWPEFERYWRSSRVDWTAYFLQEFPIPASVRRLDQETFVKKAWSLVKRKAYKQVWLEELYELAGRTIGLPISLDSVAVKTFRYQLA